MRLKVEILRGETARALFESVDVRDEWRRLHERCPWSTVFQSLPFVETWYRHYGTSYEPLLVIGRDGDGTLAGIVPLAVERESGKLVVAGTHHAEYQVWLALPELRTEFIESALESLREAFPSGRLQFIYVRPDAPLDSFRAGGAWRSFSELHAFPRGLMALGDGSAFRESMKKRTNARHITALKKLGSLQFQRVEPAEELAAEFEELIAFNDFRKGAAYAKLPFRSDPGKKPFHLALLGIPGLLHASVMRLDGRAISAYLAAVDRDQAIGMFFAYSPFMAKHSIGRLHLLSLGTFLAEEGFRDLDLTPGEGYKNQFATRNDDVFVLTIFFSRAACLRHRAKLRISGMAKTALRRLSPGADRTPATLGRELRNAARPGSLAGMRSALYDLREMKLYAADIGAFTGIEDPRPMHRDDLNDLMSFEAAEGRPPSVQEFLVDAQTKFEAGCHAYTSVVDGILACSGWLAERLTTLHLGEVDQEWRIPEGGVVLFDFYVRSNRHREETLRGALVQMLHDASAIAGGRRAYIPVAAGDAATSRVLERMGFRHEASFFRKRALFRSVRWSTLNQGE